MLTWRRGSDQSRRAVGRDNAGEAEVLTLAFQAGLRQLWREHVLSRYVRGEISRAEAIAAVGIDWVEMAERQRQAMQEDLTWALEQ